jgi:hypothetical protein
MHPHFTVSNFGLEVKVSLLVLRKKDARKQVSERGRGDGVVGSIGFPESGIEEW